MGVWEIPGRLSVAGLGSPQVTEGDAKDQGGPLAGSTFVAEHSAEGGDPGPTSESTEGMDISAATEGEGDPSGAVSTGQMTAEQAERLVDSVKDGTPRVVVGGRGSEKDW